MKDDKGERLVNAPAPKPMPYFLDEWDSRIMRRVDDPAQPNGFYVYAVATYHDDEQARLIVEALCRPQQSAEPVAWYDLPMANIELADAIVQEWQKRVESGAPAMPWGTGELVELISKLRPAAFPGPSELVEEMEKRFSTWDGWAYSDSQMVGGDHNSRHVDAGYKQAVTDIKEDLRALITRHRGKS